MKKFICFNLIFYLSTFSFVRTAYKYSLEDIEEEELPMTSSKLSISRIESFEEKPTEAFADKLIPLVGMKSPEFLEYCLSRNDLLDVSRELIRSHFDPIAICTYLRPNELPDMMNFAAIIKGMILSDHEDIATELLDVWGYYLTTQIVSCEAALQDLKDVSNEKSNIRFIDRYLSVCRRLNVLDENSKRSIVDHLLTKKLVFLKISNIGYLYAISESEVKSIFKSFINRGVFFEPNIPISLRSFENDFIHQ